MSRNGQWRKIRGVLSFGIALAGGLLWPRGVGAPAAPAPLASLQPAGDRPTFHSVDLARGRANCLSNYLAQPSAKPWPRGSQNLAGVPFQMDGQLEVSGLEAARRGEFLPSRVTDIPVGRKARRLMLLHGTRYSEKDGVPVAKLVLHYAGGESRSLRIIYGVHARNSVKEREGLGHEKNSRVTDPNSQIAWTGANDDDQSPGAPLRLFETALANPLPDQEIRSVDLVSLFSRASSFIVALTLEEGGAPLASPRSARARKIKRALERDDSLYNRQITVSARDAQDGQALTNSIVNLTLTDDQSSFFFGEYRCDSQGQAIVDYPPQQTVGLRLQVKAPGHIPGFVLASRTNRADFPLAVTAKLERGVNIGGVVTDLAGKAVGGVEVLVSRVERDGPSQYTQTDYDTVRTDSAGRWTSASVPRDFSGFTFQLTHAEYRPVIYAQAATNQPGARQVATQELLAKRATMAMPPALHLAGVVADAEGRPVSGAEILVENSKRPLAKQTLKTDDRGRFTLVLPEPLDLGMAVLAKGYTPRYLPVPVEPEAKPFEIVLEKAKALKGRVLDFERQPVEGATVKLESWNNTRLLHFRAQTDAEGRFTWEATPEGSLLFSVTKTNYVPMRIYPGPAAGGELVLTVNKISKVSGRVVDADTQKPLDEFNVIRGVSFNPGEPMRWERYNVIRGRYGEYSIPLNEYYNYNNNVEMKVLIEAQGYVPVASPAYKKPGWYTNDVALKRGKGIAGVVELPGGEPVARAAVILVDASDAAYMDLPGQFRPVNSGGDYLRTDASGRFEFSPKLDAHTIFAADEKGYAQVRADQVAASGKVVLAPWGRVKGVLRVGKKVEPNQGVRLQNIGYRYGEEDRSSSALALYLRAEPDASGNFTFEKVPPGERRVWMEYKLRDNPRGEIAMSHGTPVLVKPGETAEVTIGGTGRPVIGKIVVVGGDPADVDWKRDVHHVNLRLPANPENEPVVMPKLATDEERQKFWQERNERQKVFWRSDKGRALDRAQRSYVLVFNDDGSFRSDNVPPGDYGLSVAPTDPRDPNNNYRQVGRLDKPVTVPEAPAGRADEPFDLGSLELQTKRTLKVGDLASPFETVTLEGKPLKLADYRGKIVLLDFWATWAGSRAAELPVLKSIYDTYGKDERFAMISLSVDHDAKAAENFVSSNGVKWVQGFLGQMQESSVPPAYGVDGIPATFLIDPEGKIAAKNLYGLSIRSVVRKALAEQKASAK